MPFYGMVAHCFLSLNNIQLQGCSTVCFVREEDISFTFLRSFGWSKNEIDMREINMGKPNKSLITRIHGRDPGKLSNLPKLAEALTLNVIFS